MSTELAALQTVESQIILEEKLFELAQRKAKVYSGSSLVPKEYQGNVGNVLIAENMAKRMGADVLMVMQNLYVVHGRPGWSAQFLIATFNSCQRFSAIKYRFTGDRSNDTWGCVAYATELATGKEVEGTEVTLKMAKAEGWYQKNGSKWQTMPEQMLRYRAATFFIRTTAPEIGMGLLTAEELRDIDDEPTLTRSRPKELTALAAQYAPETVIDAETVTTETNAGQTETKADETTPTTTQPETVTPEPETPKAPPITEAELLAKIKEATTADQVSDIAFCRHQLKDEAAETRVDAAARARKAEIRAAKTAK